MHEDRELMWVLLVVGFLPIALTSGIGLRFALRMPEKLQSEDYQLRQQSLQMLQGAEGGPIVDAEAIVAIANPVQPDQVS
jgi:hypothetical protein